VLQSMKTHLRLPPGRSVKVTRFQLTLAPTSYLQCMVQYVVRCVCPCMEHGICSLQQTPVLAISFPRCAPVLLNGFYPLLLSTSHCAVLASFFLQVDCKRGRMTFYPLLGRLLNPISRITQAVRCCGVLKKLKCVQVVAAYLEGRPVPTTLVRGALWTLWYLLVAEVQLIYRMVHDNVTSGTVLSQEGLSSDISNVASAAHNLVELVRAKSFPLCSSPGSSCTPFENERKNSSRLSGSTSMCSELCFWDDLRSHITEILKDACGAHVDRCFLQKVLHDM
jgi:hypothetical protein